MAATADVPGGFTIDGRGPLLANLAALRKVEPALAGKLETVPGGYPVEPSRSGAPTVAVPTADGRTIYLHSRHQPEGEARRLVEGSAVRGKGVVFVMGLGLGYHLEALFEQMGEAGIVVVVEPDLRMVRTALERRDLARVIESRRVMFVTEPDRPALLLRMTPVQTFVAVGVGIVSHGASAQLHGPLFETVRGWVDDLVAFCKTQVQTAVLNGRRTCENVARNLGWYAGTAGVGELRGRHKGMPAVIVSAGPSLRKNKHLLKEAQGKAVIIAVQTTLQPLLEMGVEPDYVTSLDYSEICTRFFERLPGGLRTELVAEAKASGAVLGLYPGPVRTLGNEFAEKLLREMTLRKPRLRAGATVAHLAFYLAEEIGADPIILVGQDLGFADGLSYVPGTGYEDVWRPELGRFCTMEMRQWEHVVRERPILRKIEDQHGRPMYTEERLFAYLQQFERDFATSRSTIVDATEGGARKRATVAMPLAEALATFCVTPLPPRRAEARGVDRAVAPRVVECLRKRRAEGLEIIDIGHATMPLLRQVAEHLDDQDRVNRLIREIDGLRDRMMALNDTYELVTSLTQGTEMKRFERDFAIAADKVEGTEKQRRQVERDVANVEGVIEAAGEFVKLMDEVIGQLGGGQ